MKSIDDHFQAISQEIPQPSTTEISLKLAYVKFHSNLPGANELKRKSACKGLTLS